MALGKDTATIDFRALRKLYNLWPNHTVYMPRVLHFSAFHLHINYIVYKHFDRSLHVGSSDPYVQNFRPAPLTVLEILGFKLKNENDNDKKKKKKKNWRNGLFAISLILVVRF